MTQKRRYPNYPTQASSDQVPQITNQAPQAAMQQQVPMYETQGEQQVDPFYTQLQQQYYPTQQQPQQQQTQYQNQQTNYQQQQQPQQQVEQHPERQEVAQHYQVPQEEQNEAITQSEIIQFTHQRFPVSNTELLNSKFPTGLLITPYLEENVPAVDFNEKFKINPPRCQNCKAFVSCYSIFTSGGRHVCPLCGMESQLDYEYERVCQNPEYRQAQPELTSEVYEIITPDIYRIRRGETFETLLFLIDISPQAIKSGLVRSAANQIKQQLEYFQTQGERIMISILLVNTQVHFLIFRSATNFEIYTVPDVDNPFLPAPRDVIVSLKSRGQPILHVLTNLEEIAKSIPTPISSKNSFTNSINDVAFYTAIEQAYKCMQTVGGKVLYFLSTMPSCGLGSLHQKAEGRKQAGKSQAIPDAAEVKSALTFQNEKYTDLGVKCAFANVSIDGIVATFAEFVDLAALNDISRSSSGIVRHLPEYDDFRDQELLRQYVDDAVHLSNAMEACVRIRASPQIEIKQFYGQGQISNGNLVNLAHVNVNQTLGVEIGISGILKQNQYVYFQASYLFTDKMNVRYARVVTKRLRVDSTLMFLQSFNVQPLIALMAKKLCFAMRKNTDTTSPQTTFFPLNATSPIHAAVTSAATLEQTINGIYGTLIGTLQNYSRLTNYTMINQFPTKVQELICYVFALSKCPMSRPIGSKIFIDERACFMSRLENGNIAQIINLIYPQCYDIGGNRCRLNADFIQSDQIYIISGPYQIFVYIGAGVAEQTILDVTEGFQINLQLIVPLNLNANNTNAHNLKKIIKNIQQEVGYSLPVICVTGHGKLIGPVYSMLLESRVDGMCFADFTKLVGANLNIQHK